MFPKPGPKLPITALQRIAPVTFSGKIESRLQRHPISESDAATMNSIMADKVTRYYGLPFNVSPTVLTSPLEGGGLQFPSFVEMNASHSKGALHRAMNSNNQTIRNIFRIIHANYQCAHHSCHYPLAPEWYHQREGTRGHHKPPSNRLVTWEIARS